MTDREPLAVSLYFWLQALASVAVSLVLVFLFLGRLTNLADGASFLIEAPSETGGATGAGVTKDEVRELLLDALADLAANLQKN